MRLAASTLGQLYERPLAVAVRRLAEAGYSFIELAAAPPHLSLGDAYSYARRRAERAVRTAGVTVLTVSGFSLDLVHPHEEVAAFSARQLRAALELAHDLGAESVVFPPGRRFALLPAPIEQCLLRLRSALEELLPVADRLGVSLALENAPFGFLETAESLISFVDDVGHPRLGITFDAANAIVVEDPTAAVARIGVRLRVAHLSGSESGAWAHTSIRQGGVDVASFARALKGIAFHGPTVYEFLDGEDPVERLARDLPLLEREGWSAQPIVD